MESNSLSQHIDSLDPKQNLDLLQLSGTLRTLVGERQATPDELAEQFAVLAIGLRRGGQASPWGDYFGPFSAFYNGNGEVVENPPLGVATPAFVEYWIRRSELTPHPVMKARFADLAWDLWRKVGAQHPGIEVARRAIDSYLRMLDEGLDDHDVWSEMTMGRVLGLARSIKDEPRTKAAIAAIIRRQVSCNDPDAPGTWGMAFKVLLGPDGPKLEEAQIRGLVGGVEEHVRDGLKKVRDSGIPHPTLDFVRMLAEYYWRTGRRGDVERILGSLVDAMLGGNQSAAGLVRLSWLESVDEILRAHGLSALRQRLAAPLRRAGEETLENLHPLTSELTIPNDKLRKFVAFFTEHERDELFGLIAARFITPRDDLERQVQNRTRIAPLTSLVSKRILDGRGRAVATVGSVADDPQGNLISQAALAMQINTLFLRAVLEEAQKVGSLDEEGLVRFCLASPAYVSSRAGILQKGIGAYLAGEWVECVHLLVPCFEDGVRELAREIGPLPIDFDPDVGGWREPTLGKLLSLRHVQEAFGPDLILHWRALFTDARGLNLRNRIAHGLAADAECSRDVGDRVLHSILQLGQFRIQLEDEQGAGGGHVPL